MKKSILSLALLGIFLVAGSPFVSGQSLLDNEFYKKARDLISQSQAAMEAGDYDGAARLAEEAKDSLAKSDEYVATATQFYRANGWLSVANDRIIYARSIQADTNYRDAYDKAVADVGSARTALDAKDYPGSIDYSKSAIAALKDVAPVVAVTPPPEPEPIVLPEYYVVRLVLPLRDCFWRIAAYPFVYNDPWKWKLLYEANKSVLQDPNNPDLIQAGQRFVIPALAGETREGEYDPLVEYPALPPAQ